MPMSWLVRVIRIRYYHFLSQIALYCKLRWCFTVWLLIGYIWNFKSMSFDIVTYLLACYFLEMLAALLTPKGCEEEGDGDNDEFII